MDMAKFEIDGKEYELKITFDGIKEINERYDSPLEFVGMTIAGNLDATVDAVRAGLLHAGKGFNRTRIETEIQKAIENEKADLQELMKLGYEVVSGSFFYKKTVKKLLNQDPEMKKQYDMLMK
jgi:hypothetical protein